MSMIFDMSPETFSGFCLLMVCIAAAVIGLFGLAKPAVAAKALTAPKMAAMRCDCGPEHKCLNGRRIEAGDPYRCTIWKEETQ